MTSSRASLWRPHRVSLWAPESLAYEHWFDGAMEVAQDDDDSGGSEVRVWACKDAEEPAVRARSESACAMGLRIMRVGDQILATYVHQKTKVMQKFQVRFNSVEECDVCCQAVGASLKIKIAVHDPVRLTMPSIRSGGGIIAAKKPSISKPPAPPKPVSGPPIAPKPASKPASTLKPAPQPFQPWPTDVTVTEKEIENLLDDPGFIDVCHQVARIVAPSHHRQPLSL